MISLHKALVAGIVTEYRSKFAAFLTFDLEYDLDLEFTQQYLVVYGLTLVCILIFSYLFRDVIIVLSNTLHSIFTQYSIYGGHLGRHLELQCSDYDVRVLTYLSEYYRL